jgi:hypothetical protein
MLAIGKAYILPITHLFSSNFMELQGEHLLVEVFSVTKFGKIFKKTYVTNPSIGCRGFNKFSI